MSILKRILIIITIIVAILAGFAVFAMKSGYFTVDVRDYVISLIKKNTGKDVRIGRIEIGIYNNIVVHDVSMPVARTFSEPGEFASIGSIIIRFNLLDLVAKKKNFNSTLSRIIIDRPLIYLKKENGEFNLGKFVSSFTIPQSGTQQGQMPLPINKIFIQNGKIIYEDRDNTFNSYVDNLSGTIFLKEDPLLLRINLSGKTKDSIKKNIFVDFDYYIGNNRFRGNMRVADSPLTDWGAYLMQPKDFSIISGNFSIDAAASGTGFRPELMKIYGYAGVKNGSIMIKGQVPVSDINGSVEVNDDKAKLRQAFFRLYGGKGVVKGTLNQLFGNMDFNLNAGITGINLGEISPQNMTGSVKAYFNAVGNKNSQKADFRGQWDEGSIRGIPVKAVSLKASFDKDIIKLDELKGLIGSGTLNGGGHIDIKSKKNNLDIFAGAEGLDVQKLAGQKKLTGSTGIALKVQGTFSRPKIIVDLKSAGIKYSGNDVDNLTASFVSEGSAVKAVSAMSYKNYKNLKLSSAFDVSDTKVTIGDFKLQNGKNLLVSAKGGILLKDGTLGITITAKDIMLSDLALSFLSGKNIDGAVRGDVFIRGTKDNPLIDMSLNMNSLKVREGIYKVALALHYGDNALRIREINFNDNLKGSGAVSLKKKIFDANFDVAGLKGDVLSEFFGNNVFDGSVINGKVLVKKEDAGYGGSISLDAAYIKGINRNAIIDISGSNNSFSINRFEITQKNGTFRNKGSFSIKNDSQISAIFNGKFEKFRINDKLEVSAVYGHNFEFFMGDDKSPVSSTNILKASKISFNGKTQDDLDVTVKTLGSSIPEINLKWGPGYLLDASLNAEPVSPQIKAKVTLKDADLYRIYTLLNSREKPLTKEALVSGEFNISGPVNHAKVMGTLSQEEGNTTGDGFLDFEKKNGIYWINSFDIKYSAVNVDIKNFVSIFDEKFKGSGSLNGSGWIKSSQKKYESAGNVILSTGKMADIPYDSITANYAYKDKKIVLDNGVLKYKDSFLKLDGSSFEIKGDNDYYATILTQTKDFYLKGNKLNGNLNFYGRILNDKSLKIDGSVGSDNFTFKKHTFTPFVLKINYESDIVKVQSSKGKNNLSAELHLSKDSIDFKKYTVIEPDGNVMMNITGSIATQKDGESNFNVDIKNIDPQMANDLLGWDHTWSGKGNGYIKISGNPEKGLGWTIYVTLSNGMVDGVDFDILTGLVLIKDDKVNLSPIDPLVLTKTDKYQIKVKGTIPVALSEASVEKIKGSEMNLNAQVKGGDLSVIKFLKFIDDASGPIDADLKITGTREFPNVSGRLNITGGDIKLKYLFSDLKNVYANVLVKDNVIDIYTMKADTDRGTIKVENLNEKKGGIMKFMKPYEVNWRITNVGDKVRFTDTTYMDFISGDADMNLEMTGLLEAPFVRGTMKFENAKIVFPVKMRTKSGEQADTKDNYVKKITWDVSVFGGDNVRYYNNYYNNFADITMKFIKDQPIKFLDKGNDMKIIGSVGVERGTYKYLNTELTMDSNKESKITFDGDRRPVLDVYATTLLKKFQLNKNLGTQMNLAGGAGSDSIISRSETMDLNIYVRFWGRVGNVNLDMTSDPPLDRNRLLYILTFNQDTNKDIRPEDALKYVDIFANSWIKGGAEVIKGFTPLDVVDVKVKNIVPVAQKTTRTADDTTNVSLEVGKTVGGVYFKYGTDITDITTNQVNVQHTLGAEVPIDKQSKFVVEGIFGSKDPGSVSTPGFEGKVSYQIGTSFESWGAKPTPTPSVVPTPRHTPVAVATAAQAVQ